MKALVVERFNVKERYVESLRPVYAQWNYRLICYRILY